MGIGIDMDTGIDSDMAVSIDGGPLNGSCRALVWGVDMR